MTEKSNGYRLLQITAAVMVVAIIISVFLFPGLLSDESELIPLQFTADERIESGDEVVLRGQFDRNPAEHEMIWVYAENAEITLYCNGKVYRCNERGDTPAMFRSPGSGWYGLSVPGIFEKESVKIAVRSYYGEGDRAAEAMLTRMYAGDGSGLYRLLAGQIDLFAMILICAFFAGILYLVEGLISIYQGVYQEGKRIAIFGTYCLFGGLWCVTDVCYPYLSLIISPSWTAAFLDALGLLLFPVIFTLMMRYYIRGRRIRGIMMVLAAAEAVVAAICLIRQLLGQADLLEQQLLIGSVALLVLVIATVCIVSDLWRFQDRNLWLLLFTALPVFVAVVLDGVNIIFPFMQHRMMMRYGFALSILVLVRQLVSYAKLEMRRLRKFAGWNRSFQNHVFQ